MLLPTEKKPASGSIALAGEEIRVDQVVDVGAAINKTIDMLMNEGNTKVMEIICACELAAPFRGDMLLKPVGYGEKYKGYQ